jgi:hypothetical protein
MTDHRGPNIGNYHIYRGGSCYDAGRNCRLASRNGSSPDNRIDGVGFRPVLAAPVEKANVKVMPRENVRPAAQKEKKRISTDDAYGEATQKQAVKDSTQRIKEAAEQKRARQSKEDDIFISLDQNERRQAVQVSTGEFEKAVKRKLEEKAAKRKKVRQSTEDDTNPFLKK